MRNLKTLKTINLFLSIKICRLLLLLFSFFECSYLMEKKKLCNGYELGFLTMKVDQICIRYLNESDKDFSMHSKFLHLLRYESLVFEDIVFYWP